MQKSIVFFWLCLSLLIIPSVYAQQNVGEPAFGLKGGLNVSSLSNNNSQVNSAAVGFHAGAYITTMLSDKVGIQPELVYSQQGYRVNAAATFGDGFNVRYNYLNIPVIFKLYVADGANIQLGPQIGYLISSNFDPLFSTDSPRKFDAAVALGVAYETDGGLNFALRYNWGFINVTPASNPLSQGPSLTNQVFQLSVGYTFGQK